MSRFDKWSTVELKILYADLINKKQKSCDDVELIEKIKIELNRRGVNVD